MSMLSRRAVLPTQKFKVGGDLEIDFGTLIIQLNYSTDFTRFFFDRKGRGSQGEIYTLEICILCSSCFYLFHPNSV